MLLSKRTLNHRSDIYKDFWIEQEYISAKMDFLPSRDEEIYNDWIEQCKLIYGVDLSDDLKCMNGKWYCYYELAKNELPSSVYGDSQPLCIEKCYRKHTD